MNLQEALEELGKTEEEVARNLSLLGIKGRPEDGRECPIAHYLRRKGFTYVSVCCQEGIESLEGNFYPLPKAIEDFINSFDCDPELYTELVEDKCI